MYLDLLARTLTRYEIDADHRALNPATRSRAVRAGWDVVRRALGRRDLELVKRIEHDPRERELGVDIPVNAETGVGLTRIDQLRTAIETVLAEGVPGDLLEAGVLRGGASIYMRGVLAVNGETNRTVWVADSFEGPPPPDLAAFPEDEHMFLHLIPEMAVPLPTVQRNFARYGLLDDQVRFLKGWFKDTLPNAPIEQLAILRLDGDSYEATTQIFEALYDKVSPGGFVVVDDYLRFEECRKATDDFRAARGVLEEIQDIDLDGVVWRKRS